MTNAHARMKITDMPSFTLRVPPDLRAALEREAFANSRSLGQECAVRLKASFDVIPATPTLAEHRRAATVVHTGESLPQPTDMHRQLTALFDALPPDKQLALLTFLRR